MCLMQTDLPVPDGPRIIEIWSSGRPRLRPFRIVLRPNALMTSMNSTASSAPCSRVRPCATGTPRPRASARGSSSGTSSASLLRRRLRPAAAPSARLGGPRPACGAPRAWSPSRAGRAVCLVLSPSSIAPPRSVNRRSALLDSIPRRSAYPPSRPGAPSPCSGPSTSPSRSRLPPGPPLGRISVIAAHEHDDGGHRHALDQCCRSRSGGFWNIQKIRKYPPEPPRRSAAPPLSSWRRSRRPPPRCT